MHFGICTPILGCATNRRGLWSPCQTASLVCLRPVRASLGKRPLHASLLPPCMSDRAFWPALGHFPTPLQHMAQLKHLARAPSHSQYWSSYWLKDQDYSHVCYKIRGSLGPTTDVHACHKLSSADSQRSGLSSEGHAEPDNRYIAVAREGQHLLLSSALDMVCISRDSERVMLPSI